MNDLYQQLGVKPLQRDGGFTAMLQQFQEFKRTFTGDPKQEVQRLLSSGIMTKEQYSQFESMARQLQSIFK